MGQLPQYRFLEDVETQSKLVSWWESLEKNRGDRARLRRAESPEDVLLTEPFFRFLRQMPEEWAAPVTLLTSAMVAATLAHVKKPFEGKTFAAQLATSKAGSDKPRMSELRFQQLQKSRDPEEFFRRVVRAVKLAESNVNICSLADSILHWMDEYRRGVDREPQKRLSVRWANDYYLALK
jgi:CRISPR system Cascade subunit CasB